MHPSLPITQTINHHLAYMCLAEIQGIAGPGVIGVGVCRIGGHHVIAGAVETLKAVDRPFVIALASVVVYDVQHHADISLMKSLHHILEFEMLLISTVCVRVLSMRREEIQRHVAPVVAFLWITLKNRHQFYNRHPEFL